MVLLGSIEKGRFVDSKLRHVIHVSLLHLSSKRGPSNIIFLSENTHTHEYTDITEAGREVSLRNEAPTPLRYTAVYRILSSRMV